MSHRMIVPSFTSYQDEVLSNATATLVHPEASILIKNTILLTKKGNICPSFNRTHGDFMVYGPEDDTLYLAALPGRRVPLLLLS